MVEIELQRYRNNMLIIIIDEVVPELGGVSRHKYAIGELIELMYPYEDRFAEVLGENEYYLPKYNTKKLTLGEVFDGKGFLSDLARYDKMAVIPPLLRHYTFGGGAMQPFRYNLIDIRDLRSRWDDVLSFPVLIIGEDALSSGESSEASKPDYLEYVKHGGCLFLEAQGESEVYRNYIPGFSENVRVAVNKKPSRTVVEADSAHSFAKGLGNRELPLVRGKIEVLNDKVQVVLREAKTAAPVLVEYPFGKGTVVISLLGREAVSGPIDFGEPLQNQLLRWYAGSARPYTRDREQESPAVMEFQFSNDSHGEAYFVTHQLFREGNQDPVSEQKHQLSLLPGEQAELGIPVPIPEDGIYWHRLALVNVFDELLGYRFPDRVTVIEPEKN